jgi:hypothetical protein
MRIKKDPLTRNEYIRAGDIWVRNFAKFGVSPVTPNGSLFNSSEDQSIILHNEATNGTYNIANIAEEDHISFDKILIISDGYQFETKHRILADLPSDVAVFAINGAFSRWSIMSENIRRPINFYIVNNPYTDCMKYLPKKNRYYPSCIASRRTNPEFLRQYKGNLFVYEPTPTNSFGLSKSVPYYIDDYRNSVCAAIGMAFQFGVTKLMLMCCDGSFVEERPASEKLPNGLWTYPHHNKNHGIIDANLYWLTHQENVAVSVADHSSGLEYQNAHYIESEEDIHKFFVEDEDS